MPTHVRLNQMTRIVSQVLYKSIVRRTGRITIKEAMNDKTKLTIKGITVLAFKALRRAEAPLL